MLLRKMSAPKIQYPNLALAERCFDAFAKCGRSCSLNLRTLTITFH